MKEKTYKVQLVESSSELAQKNILDVVFSGVEQAQKNLLKENKFIKIKDNDTYDQARKRRTALKTGRTDIQKLDKDLASQLAKFRKKIKEKSEQFIEITLPAENKQQTEIDIYEAEKKRLKEIEAQKEIERINSIKNRIKAIYDNHKDLINDLNFNEVEKFKQDFEVFKTEINEDSFYEFVFDLKEKLKEIDVLISNKEQVLNLAEKNRLEAEKIAAERAILEAEKAKVRAAEAKAAEAAAAAQKKLDQERKQFEAEKAAAAEAEAAKAAKIKAEAEAKKAAEAAAKAAKIEAARVKKLQPVKKRLIEWAEFFEIAPAPADHEITKIIKVQFDQFKESAINQINNL